MEKDSMDMDNFKIEKKRKFNAFLYFSILTVNLSSFTLGLTYTWSSPAIPRLNGQIDFGDNPLSHNITPYEESWIASLMVLGAALSAFISGYLADRIGRKYTLLISTIPVMIGYSFLIFGKSVNYFYVGRFLIGLGSGATSTMVPMYTGEVSEKSNRGALGCFISVMITGGCLVIFFVSPYVNLNILSVVCLVPPVIFLIVFGLFAPESPYYYVKKNKIGLAETSLLKLRYGDTRIVREELSIIIKDVEDSFAKKVNFKELIKDKAIIKSSYVVLGLVCFQQWTGVNTVYFYLQSIFEESGSGVSSDSSAITVGIVQFLASILTLPLADKFGRRSLLLFSSMTCGLSLMATGIYFYLKEFTDYDVLAIGLVPVIALNTFFAAYNMGLGPITYTMIGELFPPHTKAIATTLSIFFCMLSTFLCTTVFPYLKLLMGMGLSFGFLGVVCFIAFIFIFFLVPETKGKSLQEVQEFLRS